MSSSAIIVFPAHKLSLDKSLTRQGTLLKLPATSAEYLKALLYTLVQDRSLGERGQVNLFEEGVGLSRLTSTGALARRETPELTAAAYLQRALKDFDPLEGSKSTSILWLDLPPEKLTAPELRAALRAWCLRHAPHRTHRVLISTDAPLGQEVLEWAREVEWASPKSDDAGLTYLERVLCAHNPRLSAEREPERRRVSERLLTRVLGLDAASLWSAVEEAAEEVAGGADAPRDMTAWEERMMGALQRAKSSRLHRAVGLELQPLDGFTGDQLGGMDRYKRYLEYMAALLHHPKERDSARLTPPKGVLLVGLPGCGKSLAAKLTASQLSLPLMRLEVGSLMGGLLGQSEQQLNQALRAAESAAPCVLWIDELDKALGGLSGAEGGGTGSRLLGRLLTWMQEQQGGVYVFATANRVDKLPPELLRRGRFDELWKVVLPTDAERQAILSQKLRERGVVWADEDLREAVKLTSGYTGADLEAIVREAQVQAFCAMEEGVTLRGLRAVQANFTPMSAQFKGEIASMSAALDQHGFRDVSGVQGLPPEVAAPRRVMGAAELERLLDLSRPLRFYFGEWTLQVEQKGHGWITRGLIPAREQRPIHERTLFVLHKNKDKICFREHILWSSQSIDHSQSISPSQSITHVVCEGGSLFLCADSGRRWKETGRVEIVSGTKMFNTRYGVEQYNHSIDGVDFAMVSIPNESFLISKTQVTQELWSIIMGDNPSQFKSSGHPVERVSWSECIEFLNKLSTRLSFKPVYAISEKSISIINGSNGFRLPLEKEWEIAASAKLNLTYSGGNNIHEVAQFASNRTYRVRSYKPNAYGIYDMSGNVWEWCFDSHIPNKRAKRGGSWSSKPEMLRINARMDYDEQSKLNDTGLRICQDIL